MTADNASSRPHGLSFETGFRPSASARKKEPTADFNILLAGNFSGRATPPPRTGPHYTLEALDLDNVERVIARLNPRVAFDLPDGAFALAVREFESFHPDSLMEHDARLSALLALRRRLKASASAAAAASEVDALLGPAAAPAVAAVAATVAAPAAPAAGGALNFADLLNMKPGAKPTPAPAVPGAPAAASAGKPVVDNLIQSILAGTGAITAAATPTELTALARVEAALTARLRGILHHPAFQALEAAWRGVQFVLQNVETDANVHLYLLDLSQEALAAELLAAADLSAAPFYQSLNGHEAAPFGLIVGNYAFGPGEADLGLLGRLGIIGLAQQTPCVAAAAPALAGLTTFAGPLDMAALLRGLEGQSPAWMALRGTPVAAQVALTAPRVLLRLPYGQGGETIDGFRFEELDAARRHNDLLWGNAAFLLACVYARAYLEDAEDPQPRRFVRVDDLPGWSFTLNGESEQQPCAEAWLPENQAQALTGLGLLAVQAVRRQPAVQFAGLNAIAYPARELGV